MNLSPTTLRRPSLLRRLSRGCGRATSMTLQFSALVAFSTVAVMAQAADTATDASAVPDIEIVPGTTLVAANVFQGDIVITPGATMLVTPKVGGAEGAGAASQGQSYADVYKSIPFSRSTYRADPTYRHDATLEILFGKLRPTTVVKHQARARAVSEVIDTGYNRPYGTGHGNRQYYYPGYFDFSRGPYSRYQGLFGYRGGYRSMYYNYGRPYSPYRY